MSLSNPSPQGTGNYVEEDVERGEEQEVVDDSQRAASSRPIGSMCYKLTETDSKHKIHSCLNQVKYQHSEEVNTKSHP